jgi:hypothetical protein
VTGDGVPEYIYGSWDCASCGIRWVTVFAGPNAIFDDDEYLLPTVEASPDHKGFIITEKVALPGETVDTASGRIIWTFRFNGSRFTFVNKEETRVNASAAPTAVPPPASGSVQNYPTPAPSTTATQFKQDAKTYIGNMLDALEPVTPVTCSRFCLYAYEGQRDLYYQEWRLNSLNGPALPQQCGGLWRTIIDLSFKANAYVDAGREAAKRGDLRGMQDEVDKAMRILGDMLETVAYTPGTCR